MAAATAHRYRRQTQRCPCPINAERRQIGLATLYTIECHRTNSGSGRCAEGHAASPDRSTGPGRRRWPRCHKFQPWSQIPTTYLAHPAEPVPEACAPASGMAPCRNPRQSAPYCCASPSVYRRDREKARRVIRIPPDPRRTVAARHSTPGRRCVPAHRWSHRRRCSPRMHLVDELHQHVIRRSPRPRLVRRRCRHETRCLHRLRTRFPSMPDEHQLDDRPHPGHPRPSINADHPRQ